MSKGKRRKSKGKRKQPQAAQTPPKREGAEDSAGAVTAGWAGRSIAFGIGDEGPWGAGLEAFARSLGALYFVDWHDEGLIHFPPQEFSLVQGNFRFVLNQVIAEGGRIKFNLDGVGPIAKRTYWELREVYGDPFWRAHTDFFLSGSIVIGAALTRHVEALL